MSYLALYRSERWGINLDAANTHIPALQVPVLCDALALARQVDQIADDAQRRIDHAVVQGREAGYADGHAQGLEAAHGEAMDALTEVLNALAIDSDNERLELRHALAALTTLAVRRVLSELPPAASLQALVERALDQVLPDVPVRVGLHPEALPKVAAALQRLPRQGPLTLEADEHLDPWGCEVHTPTGRLLAGLDDQMKSVQESLSRQLRASIGPQVPPEPTGLLADAHAPSVEVGGLAPAID
jgi:flagellar biosynthesis/type III secretory pathway protein FliH